jgi:cysteine desulfurase/selenocysteine lyase
MNERPRSVDSVRELFPGTSNVTYLDTSVKGLVSTPVRDAVVRHVESRVRDGGDKAAMLAAVERAREKFATMVGAGADEVALTKNASEGLNAVARALPWEPGDNVVLCAALEHPNNVYPWLNLRDRLGVEVRMVDPAGGSVPSEAMAARVDGRTRLVTVPTVSFSPGLVTDLEPIAAACRHHGAFFLVDAAQSAGVIDTDVDAMGIDGLATATQKAIGSFYGTGFLYCRRSWAERLHPAYLARYGVAVGDDAHETALDTEKLVMRAGARRFDLGNYNYLGAVAADAALQLLLDVGVPAIEARARGLARRLAEGMAAHGLPLAGGAGADLAHIVAVGQRGGTHDTTDDPRLNSLYEHLTDSDVRLSIRRGVLRMSLHAYNNEADVDRVLELTERWKSRA